jgi:hypothetical protein
VNHLRILNLLLRTNYMPMTIDSTTSLGPYSLSLVYSITQTYTLRLLNTVNPGLNESVFFLILQKFSSVLPELFCKNNYFLKVRIFSFYSIQLYIQTEHKLAMLLFSGPVTGYQ